MTFHVNDDMNTDLQESSSPMLRSLTIFKRSCVVSSALPTLNQRIVNLTDVTLDMDTDPPGSSAPMITSDLMVVDWEDRICGRPRYSGQDGHDMIDADSSDPNVRETNGHGRPGVYVSDCGSGPTMVRYRRQLRRRLRRGVGI